MDSNAEQPEPAAIKKLKIPPAQSYACGTRRLAGHVRAEYLEVGGLGQAIELLALGQEKTGQMIKDLGSDYENLYQWNFVATTEQRQKVSSILTYSAFSWDAAPIIAELKSSIEKLSRNRAETFSASSAFNRHSPSAGKHESAKKSNRRGKNLVFDRTSATTSRGLRAQPDNFTKAFVDSPHQAVKQSEARPQLNVVTPGFPALIDPPVISALTNSLYPSHLNSNDPYTSPGYGTNTDSLNSLFSRTASNKSTPTLTPPNSADKVGLAASVLDRDGNTRHSELSSAQDSALCMNLMNRASPPGGATQHLGDGITQFKSHTKPCNLDQFDHDAIAGAHQLVDCDDDGFPYTGVTTQGLNGKVYLLQPSGLIVRLRNAKLAYTPLADEITPEQHGIESDPFPYPRSKEQPWANVICYDVPLSGSPDSMAPLYATSQVDKRIVLAHKLATLFKQDRKRLHVDGLRVRVSKEPVHIFIDLSNIVIGFYDYMKMLRGIPLDKRIKAPGFSFDNFHSLLSRNRQVGKKIVVGSRGWNAKRPSYEDEASQLGYEMNILSRVTKAVVAPRYRKKTRSSGGPSSDGSSGADTSGDDGFVPAGRQGEQGVDELLHFKILESVVDTKNDAGTIVLATGDGAQAEFSGGFKAQMERALRSGWHVELYSWSHNLSSAWKSYAFTQEWGARFRHIPLDDYVEELHRWWLEPQQA